nr:uncharacterized protein LOC107429932 [Ziziphus jujuba var. spinosa]
MKRKDFDDICEEFSSVYFSLPSTKARRLDAEIFPISNEDSRTTAPQTVEHGLPQEPHSTGSSSMLHKNLFQKKFVPRMRKPLSSITLQTHRF